MPAEAHKLVATDDQKKLLACLQPLNIGGLDIVVSGNELTLLGVADSWHAKQLATSAVREQYPNIRIHNHIHVRHNHK